MTDDGLSDGLSDGDGNDDDDGGGGGGGGLASAGDSAPLKLVAVVPVVLVLGAVAS
jgi:hypothetical protein